MVYFLIFECASHCFLYIHKRNNKLKPSKIKNPRRCFPSLFVRFVAILRELSSAIIAVETLHPHQNKLTFTFTHLHVPTMNTEVILI